MSVRIGPLFTPLLLLIGVLSPLQAQREPAREDVVKWQSIIVPAAKLNPVDLESRLRQMLIEKPFRIEVMRVVVMDREESSVLDEKGFTDVTYGLWQTLFRDYEKTIPPFAELLVVGNNAAMRVRDPEGGVSVKVLAGDDPFTLEACGTRFDVAHVSVSEAGRSVDSSDSSSSVHFFLVTRGKIAEKQTRCMFDRLRESISATTIWVSVRNDPWFITDSNFPVVLPFLTDAHPPTKREYETSTEWVCTSYGKVPHCEQQGHASLEPTSQ